MKIDVWADYVCPFCYLGITRVKRVLKELNIDYTITHHVFQLDPSFNENQSITTAKYLSDKYGLDEFGLERNFARLSAEFNREGIVYNYDIAQVANTKKAHKLSLYVEKNFPEIDEEFKQELYKLHFEYGKNLSSIDDLVEVAKKFNINEEDAKNAILGTEQDKEFYEDITIAQQFEITGVPFFLINDKYVITGAQNEIYFKEAFLNIQNEKE